MRRAGISSGRRRSRMLLALLVSLPAHGEAVPAGMVAIPAGTTTIGSERGRADEKPPFSTKVEAFYLDKTPVTVSAYSKYVQRTGFVTEAERLGSGSVMTFGTGQWKLVSGANWRYPLGDRKAQAQNDHPVTQVSWNDASAYCVTQGKRLPSEIEYEYAARVGNKDGTAHAFGDDLIQNGHYRANVWTGVFPLINTAQDGYRTTSPVGAFGEGPLGLTDMAGNVWEWASDWYRPYVERDRAWPKDVKGEKVQRGGSFLCDPKICYGFRVTARGHATPDSSHMHVGFRCAQSLKR